MHEYFHTTFGFCLWDLAALAVLVLIVVILVLHVVRQRRRERDMQDELADRLAGSADPAAKPGQ